MARVSIIAIGNELVRGKLNDTNSSFIAAELQRIGVAQISIRLVADNRAEIITAIRQEAATADWILTTGGLGPTSDDGTREAIADAVGSPLECNEASLAKLEAYCKSRNRKLNENNRTQAYVPQGAEIITNHAGTADAFICKVKHDNRAIPLTALPGVPGEMKRLIREQLLSRMQQELPGLQEIESIDLRCFGLAESEIAERIEKSPLPAAVEVSYRPQFPEILIQLACPKNPEHRELLTTARALLGTALQEEHIISESEQRRMPEVVSDLLTERGLTLAAAESCSGGLFASELVRLPGASTFFLGSIVSYSNSAKEQLLGVAADTLATQGAVSKETVLEMARGARERFQSDIAISISGIAGPDGGSEEKPVGTVWLGFSANEYTAAFHLRLPWGRSFVRIFCVHQALDIIRRYLLQLPLNPN